MKNRVKDLLAYVEGTKSILEGKCEGACTANALLNLDAMEKLIIELRDSPREVNKNYSGDLEFHVDLPSGEVNIYETVDDAAPDVLITALTRGECTLDVVVFSKAGARAYGGDDAVDEYKEDPEASVFDRFEITVNNLGRVP